MKKNKGILFNLILFLYLIIVFVVSCVICSHFMSEGNVDLTAQMPEATLPIIHMDIDGVATNYLHGYTEPMNCAYMRDTLTVVESNRRIDYVIDTYGTAIDEMSYEVRSIDGTRLVENTALDIYSKHDDTITGYFTIKDLITNGDEYMLIYLLTLKDGTVVRYYSRLIWSEDLHVADKVAFVDDFTKRTFDKERATEITKYLESDNTGDNSSYNYVNIHSSFKQVTWGDLDVRRLSVPRVTISELTSATGFFKVEYQVEIREEASNVRCNVTEFFRVRYTTDRLYLLGWERHCNQIIDENSAIYSGDKIELGICPDDIELVESDGGTNFAFAYEGKLISVNALEQKVALVYSFYNPEDYSDLRSSYQAHRIHILKVDETGNVSFVVYGYMNRGRYEGRVGIGAFSYNSAMNTVEQLAFVDCDRAQSIVMRDVDELSYIDRDNRIYLMLDRNVYEVNPESESLSTVATQLLDDSYHVSSNGSMLVWQNDGSDIYNCTKLRLMNLATGIGEDIKAGYGEYILPLGFMGDDLVYGLARSREVTMNLDGSQIFPMYKLIIRSSDGEILKEYSESGIYVMDCEFGADIMNMKRAVYNEKTDTYDPVDNDQIVSIVENQLTENVIKTVVTESLETIVQVDMKDEMVGEDRVILTPKELIYEGNRELARDEADFTDRFYVYGLTGYMGGYMAVSNAVNDAYESSGIVVDESGKYIWYKTTKASKNQIMAITAPDQVKPEESLAVCVDTVLRYEGITTNSRILLSQGESVQQILSNYMDSKSVLNLTGCNLDSVLYYVNKDIPVLAIYNDSSAVLITGFNDSQVVLFDPSSGELRKENITDADNIFKMNGYKFLTYVK